LAKLNRRSWAARAGRVLADTLASTAGCEKPHARWMVMGRDP